MAKSFYNFPELCESKVFSKEETESIDAAFFNTEKPIHFKFKSSLRVNAKLIEKSAVALSPHFAIFYKQEKENNYTPFISIFIKDINFIAYTDGLVLVQTNSYNIIINSPEAFRFSQLLYRNFQISFPKLHRKQNIQVRAKDMSAYPPIKIPLSKTQTFQMTYLAECAKENVSYIHDVVRYVHSLLVNNNTIVDVSRLPIRLLMTSDGETPPVISSLSEISKVQGISCANTQISNIIYIMTNFMQAGADIQIVNIENSGVTKGFEDFASFLRSFPNYRVSYWNLSNNSNISDIEYFPDVLAHNASPLLCLNLSHMKIRPSVAINIFSKIEKNINLQKIRKLSLGGFPFSDKKVGSSLDSLLKTLAKNKTLHIEYLDLDGLSNGFDSALQAFTSVTLPLKYLNLSNNTFSYKSIEYLKYILSYTDSLEELDLSSANLEEDDIEALIQTISDNGSITKFKLHLNDMNINGPKLLTVLGALIESKREKWTSLSFENNSISVDDFKVLVAYLKRMHNIEELSLANNFDSSMKDIGGALTLLKNVKSLVKLNIAGSSSKKLGSELFPLLNEIIENPKFTFLDISCNSLGNNAIPLIAAIINKSKSLEGIFIDENSFTDFLGLESVTRAVQGSKSLVSFGFPLKDSNNCAENIEKKEDKNIFIQNISRQQINISSCITNNRISQNMPLELPFKETPGDMEICCEITKTEKRKPKISKILRHSLACEEMNVPLPFLDTLINDYANVKTIETNEMNVYETQKLFMYIDEDINNYKEFAEVEEPKKNKSEIEEPKKYKSEIEEPRIEKVSKKSIISKGEREKKNQRKKIVFRGDSSSESDEKTDDYLISEKELTRSLDFSNSDDSSSYEESDECLCKKAPKLKRIVIKDVEIAHKKREPETHYQSKSQSRDSSSYKEQNTPSKSPKSSKIPNETHYQSKSQSKEQNTPSKSPKPSKIPKYKPQHPEKSLEKVKAPPLKRQSVIEDSSESESDKNWKLSPSKRRNNVDAMKRKKSKKLFFFSSSESDK